MRSNALESNKVFALLATLIMPFLGICQKEQMQETTKFQVAAHYFNEDSTSINFEFRFLNHKKEVLHFDWLSFFLVSDCIRRSDFGSQLVSNEVINDIKRCPYNSFLIENNQKKINSFKNLFYLPSVGPGAGNIVLSNIDVDKIKSQKITIGRQWVTMRTPAFPIEVLYPEKGSEKIRIYYVFGKKGKKHILISNWFDALPLPYHYRKYPLVRSNKD
jgi:hypothetical protein